MSQRERETWWVGGGEKRREAEDKGGGGLFCIDPSAFCVANTERDTKKKSEKRDRDRGSSYSLQTSSLAF